MNENNRADILKKPASKDEENIQQEEVKELSGKELINKQKYRQLPVVNYKKPFRQFILPRLKDKI
jgi:hypothetical protein